MSRVKYKGSPFGEAEPDGRFAPGDRVLWRATCVAPHVWRATYWTVHGRGEEMAHSGFSLPVHPPVNLYKGLRAVYILRHPMHGDIVAPAQEVMEA